MDRRYNVYRATVSIKAKQALFSRGRPHHGVVPEKEYVSGRRVKLYVEEGERGKGGMMFPPMT